MDLDSVWNYIFGTSPTATTTDLTQGVNLSADTLITIFTMARALLTRLEGQQTDSEPAGLATNSLILFFRLPFCVIDDLPKGGQINDPL